MSCIDSRGVDGKKLGLHVDVTYPFYGYPLTHIENQNGVDVPI